MLISIVKECNIISFIGSRVNYFAALILVRQLAEYQWIIDEFDDLSRYSKLLGTYQSPILQTQ